jgi:hypothetical protein
MKQPLGRLRPFSSRPAKVACGVSSLAESLFQQEGRTEHACQQMSGSGPIPMKASASTRWLLGAHRKLPTFADTALSK